jgi:hypothetical protein
MRVRCIAVSLPHELESRLPKLPGQWPVELNREYEVFAMGEHRGLWYVTFEDVDREQPVAAPLALFEVTDPSIPHSWNIRLKGTEVSLQPNEMDDEYFCDDVQERRGDALDRYRRMKARLQTAPCLLERFLVEECTPHVRRLLEDAIADLSARRHFEFNQFEVTIERDKKLVVLQDVLDATETGQLQIGLGEFVSALVRCSA